MFGFVSFVSVVVFVTVTVSGVSYQLTRNIS
jgi:hypothetical protein